MDSRIDDIYKTLIDYIKQDSSDKQIIIRDVQFVKDKVVSVEEQTKKTNGRVTKLESADFRAQLQTEFTKGKTWVILALFGLIWAMVSNVGYNVLANLIASHIH